MDKLFKILLAIVIGIIFFFLFLKSCKKGFEENKQKEDTPQKSSTQSKNTYWYDTVYFSGNYGEIYYLPNSVYAAFLRATEPYCVVNKGGHQVCGNKNQDVSTELGSTPQNKELRFRSQNGKNGKIIIRTRNK